MNKKKVLILHGQPGMGHLMPAKALAEVFLKKYPEIEVKDVDVFVFFNKIIRDGYSPLYNHIVFKIPIIFKFFYKGYGNKTMQRFLEKVILFFTKKSKFISFIRDFSPDFIIATNPAPLQLLSLIKEKKYIDIPSANVCTDFGFHSLWYDSNIDYYFVANSSIKKSFIELKVEEDKIKITGIPVSQRYNQLADRDKILSDLNFSSSAPIFLIVGGQLPCRELLDIVFGIKKENSKIQFIIVAGRDKKLQEKLKTSELKNDPNIRVFNFVNNLHDYMAVSDLILSKAGGSTVAECLVTGLPMILSRTIPGQEEDNVSYMVDNGAGVKAMGVGKIIKTAVDLFNNPEKLTAMKENCKKIAKPDAAEDIVDFVASKINS